MYKAFKYRIYPTVAQAKNIDSHIACARLTYNLALEVKSYAYKSLGFNLSKYDLINQLPALRSDFKWMKSVSSECQQQAILHLDGAFTKFYSRKSKYPKFKSKRSSQSFQARLRLKIANQKLYFSLFRDGIKIIQHRQFNGVMKQVTISKTRTGKYFASILVKTLDVLPLKPDINQETMVGVDMGLKYFATTSNGLKFENPSFLRKSLSKLKFIQSKAGRNKSNKSLRKLSRLHEKISNQRRDFLHKTSNSILRDSQSIAIENLNTEGMLKNHNLALSISDASWGLFFDMLEYKSAWYGKNLVKIGRFEPSSKLCSDCGVKNKDLTLSDREWLCMCGSIHDRDINAAKNIKQISLGGRLKSQGELPVLSGASILEADLQHSASQLKVNINQ